MSSHRVVLLVEDSEDDAVFMTRGFRKLASPPQLHHVVDGSEAVDYLAGQGRYTDRAVYPFPAVMLLDLKTPRMSGFDVLRWVRTRPECRDLVIAVLTSSDHPSDIRQAYALGARSYLTKPSGPAALHDLIASIDFYWLKSNVPAPQAADWERSADAVPALMRDARAGKTSPVPSRFG